MPSAAEITQGLSLISREWTTVAILWHVYFVVIVAVALLLGTGKSLRRWTGVALVLPLLSVSALAWMTGNPFNGAVFALLSMICLVVSLRLRPGPVTLSTGPWFGFGAALMLFGWVYPHFVEARSALDYLYEAPLGLVPCPTLSMVIGLTLVLNGLDSRHWSLALSVAGLFYGIFGTVYLGVAIDSVLVLGALSLSAMIFLGNKDNMY